MDADGRLTGNVFNIKYHDMADVLDFFVLKQLYDIAIARNWNPSDKYALFTLFNQHKFIMH